MLGTRRRTDRHPGPFDIVHPNYAQDAGEDHTGRGWTGSQTRGCRTDQRAVATAFCLCKNGDIARISLDATLLRSAERPPDQVRHRVEDGHEI